MSQGPLQNVLVHIKIQYKINDSGVLADPAAAEVKDFARVFPPQEAQCHRQIYHQITDVI